MKTKNIKQSISFNCSAHDIYEALMDSKKHSKFTGAKAKIGKNIGDKFEAYDGSICGKNLELISDKKIVQLWQFDYPDWPKDYYSKVTFNIKETKGKSRILFFHTGIPEKYVDELSQGWKEFYWEPMKKMLEK